MVIFAVEPRTERAVNSSALHQVRRRSSPLRQDFAHHSTMHIGQTVIAAGVAIGEVFVVESHQVQDRGVEVVNVDGVLADVDAVLIRFAVGDAGLHACARPARRKTQ